MTTPATNLNPTIGGTLVAGYDPVGHNINALIQCGTPVQDSTTGLYYASLLTNEASADGVTLLASAAQTTTQTIANIKTPAGCKGVIICVDTTVLPGSAVSNVVTILIKDPVSGKTNTILTGAAIVGVSTNWYTCYPGATTAANVTVSFPITPTYNVVVTAGNSNSCTYSVSAIYLV